jgi:cysteinyl-tRNA synthetase
MNITDIDDKVDIPSNANTVLPCNQRVMQIILRARQTYLLNKFRSEATSLTQALLDEVRTSWDSYVRSKVSKGLPSEHVPPVGSEWQAWSELSVKVADKAWKSDALKRDEKFDMHFTAAVRFFVCRSDHVLITPP